MYIVRVEQVELEARVHVLLLYHEEDDAAIRSLQKRGIKFEHRRFKNGTWNDLRGYGIKYQRKDDTELDKKIAMVYNNKKNTKVKTWL